MHILVVDDHQYLCAAFSEHLQRKSKAPVKVTPVFTLADALVAVGSDDPPDLVFLDLNLGDGSRGAETFERLQAGNIHQVPIAVLTGLDPNDDDSLETLRQCIKLKTAGLLLKSMDIESAIIGIDRLIHGEFFVPPDVMTLLATTIPEQPETANYHLGLSPREWTVANGITRGLQNKVIAHELGLNEAYVRQVATQIYEKLGVHNKTQAAIKLAKVGKT